MANNIKTKLSPELIFFIELACLILLIFLFGQYLAIPLVWILEALKII